MLVKNELCYCELKENFQHVESNISLAVLRKKKKLFLVHSDVPLSVDTPPDYRS